MKLYRALALIVGLSAAAAPLRASTSFPAARAETREPYLGLGRPTADRGLEPPTLRLAMIDREGQEFSSDGDEAVREMIQKRVAAREAARGLELQQGGKVEEGIALLRKAAERGSVDAQTKLGFCYMNGEGVEQDEKEAFELFHQAAEGGERIAQFMLGTGYAYNHPDVAALWFERSAQGGYAPAARTLGLMFERGEGVPRDLIQALAYLMLAMADGDAKAREAASRILPQVSPAEAKQAAEYAARLKVIQMELLRKP